MEDKIKAVRGKTIGKINYNYNIYFWAFIALAILSVIHLGVLNYLDSLIK